MRPRSASCRNVDRPCALQLRLDLLDEPPDLTALCLAERHALPGAGARQVVLLGAQVLGEDYLLPLAVEERRGVRQVRLCRGVCPQVGQLLAVDDGGASCRVRVRRYGRRAGRR